MTAAAICMAAAGCAKMEETVNREILLSTVWRGEMFVPAGSFISSSEQEEYKGDYLYTFDVDGVLRVVSADPAVEKNATLKYIYTPSEQRLVIEDWGVFGIEEINVDRLRLKYSANMTLQLVYHDSREVDLNSWTR